MSMLQAAPGRAACRHASVLGIMAMQCVHADVAMGASTQQCIGTMGQLKSACTATGAAAARGMPRVTVWLRQRLRDAVARDSRRHVVSRASAVGIGDEAVVATDGWDCATQVNGGAVMWVWFAGPTS
jgi:hypothetical protein